MKQLHTKFVKCIHVFLIMSIALTGYASTSSKQLSVKVVGVEVNKTSLIENGTPSGTLDFSIYPNPASAEEVKVNISGANINHLLEITVYNTIGNVVYKTRIQGTSRDMAFVITPQQDLKEGLYFMTLKNGSDRITKKFVVK